MIDDVLIEVVSKTMKSSADIITWISHDLQKLNLSTDSMVTLFAKVSTHIT